MVYTHSLGVVAKERNKLLTILITMAFAALATVGMFLPTSASHGDLLDSFTQAELDTNWQADRQFPSDGVTSVSAFDRTDVARIGIDSSETENDTFRRTEGIKTVVENNDDFGNEVHVDLYMDPAWDNTAVRAGFWVVGDDGGERDDLFGILEFVNLETSTSGASATTNHEGWRYWDSTIGWTESEVPFVYGEWVTLTIELDAGVYTYSVNDEFVGTAVGGTSFIRELFLNSYNYGLDTFPNLSNGDYSANWHVGLLVNNPADKDECKKGGWEDFGFKNQGQCIRFVNTGQDSR